MDIIISIISTVVSAILVFILQGIIRENHRLKKEKHDQVTTEQTAIAKGVRGMLKKELKEIYVKHENSDTIPADDYETWTDMFESYEGLHGNGTFKKMDNEMKKKHII